MALPNYIFLRETTLTTWPPCSSYHVACSMAMRDSGSKWVQSTELDIMGHCAIYLSWRSRWFHLDSLVIPCWRVPIRTKQRFTVTALLLSVLVVFFVFSQSHLFLRSVSLTVDSYGLAGKRYGRLMIKIARSTEKFPHSLFPVYRQFSDVRLTSLRLKSEH